MFLNMNPAILLLASVVTFALAPGIAQESDPETITVCDALRDPLQYNGKIVALRGYLVSTDEGSWLNGDCKERLKTTSDLEWPNAVWVGGPRSAAIHNLTFERDERAMEQVRKQIAQAAKGLERYRIWVTYIGLFETWTNIKAAVYLDKSGSPRLAGFGHLGSAPAQLFIKTAEDAVVERR
jgi:hypothetical protein